MISIIIWACAGVNIFLTVLSKYKMDSMLKTAKKQAYTRQHRLFLEMYNRALLVDHGAGGTLSTETALRLAEDVLERTDLVLDLN